MDTKLTKKLKRYGTGLALLAVLTFASFTSNSEFVKVRAWALSALHMSNNNASQLGTAQVQIDSNAAKIAELESTIKKQQIELEHLKKATPSKTAPPKSYPKPPADFKPMNQNPVKKHWWQS